MIVNQPHQTWNIFGFFVIGLLLLLFAVYHETVEYLIAHWNQLEDGDYGHGYLVLAISIYLIQRIVRTIWDVPPCPQPWGLVGIGVAALLWLVSALAYVEMMKVVALWCLLLAVVWTVLGSRTTVKLLFPLLFLGFALPIWFPLSPILQELTADVVFWVVRLLNIPAFRQEVVFVLPAGVLSIEEACSGLRYLLAALTLSTLYAYLNYSSFSKRLLVVLIAAAVAVFLNIVRVVIIFYLAYVTDMQHPLVHDHLMLGWYLFGGMMIILLIIDARLNRHQQGTNQLQELTDPTVCKIGRLSQLLVFFTCALLVTAGPAAVYQMNNLTNSKTGAVTITAPDGVGGWVEIDGFKDDWMPVFRGAVTSRQAYAKENERVHLFLGYYPEQKQGKELIYDLNHISNKEIWRTHYPRGRLHLAGDYSVLEQIIEKGGVKKRLVWYWYQVAGVQVTSRYTAKALQALGQLTGNPQASVFAIATDLDDTGSARNTLDEFIKAMKSPSLEAMRQDT